MPVLLPRLPPDAAERRLELFLEDPDATRCPFNPASLPNDICYASTGGPRALPQQLESIYRSVRSIAAEHGFPGTADKAGFDVRCAVYLGEEPIFASGESLRDDVWSFVAIIMFPDIVHWRFGNSRERYFGGIRNAFQRLWMRARALDRGPDHPDRWGLIRQLNEDALVQITERPSIGADPRIARHLAEAWIRAAQRHGSQGMQDLMRAVVKALLARNVIRAYSFLSDQELQEELDGLFNRYEARLTGRAGSFVVQGDKRNIS